MKIHGKGRPRRWVELHAAIDAYTQEIVGEVTTAANVSDGVAFSAVFSQVPRSTRTVIADGAYDGRDIREEIGRRKAKALIFPLQNMQYIEVMIPNAIKRC